MEAKDTLFHINWGDGDDFYIVAPDEETAKERMPDGRDMVNYIVRLDAVYDMIHKAGIRKATETLHILFDRLFPPPLSDFIGRDRLVELLNKWQAQLKE